jgi:hypothetical protein
VIYTPTATYASNQEFLSLRTPVGVPEPGAAPLFGAGTRLTVVLPLKRTGALARQR